MNLIKRILNIPYVEVVEELSHASKKHIFEEYIIREGRFSYTFTLRKELNTTDVYYFFRESIEKRSFLDSIFNTNFNIAHFGYYTAIKNKDNSFN